MKSASRSQRTARIAVPAALWFCACNLLATGVVAQCTNPTLVPNQTISSGYLTYQDSHALKAAGVTVTGSASVSFVASNCIHLAPGFHATAGTAPTTFHAWVDAVPGIVSASPASGSGLNQQFTFTVSSPAGSSDIRDVWAIFNTSATGTNACYFAYTRASNLLFVANANETSFSPGLTPGSSGTTGSFNTNCTINGAGSSVSGAGNQLVLTVSISFQQSFAGAKTQYLNVYNNEGYYSGWQPVGTWTVGAPAQQHYTLTTSVNPTGAGTITLNPPGGTYVGGTSVTITATPSAGYSLTGFVGADSISGSRAYVTMNANRSVSADFVRQASGYTVTSAPAGLSVTVDGIAYTTPQTFAWPIGSKHTITAPASLEPGGGARYLFSGWSDGGAASHTITVPSSPATNIASYTTQYQLATVASPTQGGTVTPATNWYSQNAQVSVAAAPQQGFPFNGFIGDLSGMTTPQTVVMTGPKTVTASFSPETWIDGAAGDPAANGGAPNSGVAFPALGSTPSPTDPFFSPQQDIVIDRISASSFPGASLSDDGSGNTSVVFKVSGVNINHRVSTAGLRYVVFHSAGPISVNGAVESGGSAVAFVSATDINVTQPVNASGKAGANGGNGQLGPGGAHGIEGDNGGDGGKGGNGGIGNSGTGGAGTGGQGGGGLARKGVTGGNGSGPLNSPGQPSRTETTTTCGTSGILAGGSAGGSNGTAGAKASGVWVGNAVAYSPRPAFGTLLVGQNPEPAGGGTGGGGGCGYSLTVGSTLTAVASGGGGGGGGGAGGTVFFLAPTGNVNVSATINANGGNGGNGGAGTANATAGHKGGYGGGGGAGGAGGFIVLQGKTVAVAPGLLRADGGSGGTGGQGGGSGSLKGLNGAEGAGGGGGRIAITAASAPHGIAPSSGVNATGQQGGSPTISITVQAPQPTISAFLPTQVQAGIDRYMLTIQGSNLRGSGGQPTLNLGSSGITYTIDSHDDVQVNGWLNASNATPGEYTVTLTPAGSSQTATASLKVTAGAGTITGQYPRMRSGAASIPDRVGIWWLGPAAIDSNDGCDPNREIFGPGEAECYWTWVILTAAPGTGGSPPTATSPVTWKFTDAATNQPSTQLSFTCRNSACSEISVRPAAAFYGSVTVQATIGDVGSQIFNVGFDYPNQVEVYRIEDKILSLASNYPGYESHNFIRLLSKGGFPMTRMPVHEEFPLTGGSPARWNSCSGSQGWIEPIPQFDPSPNPDPTKRWAAWVTDADGRFSNGFGESADIVGMSCPPATGCSPGSEIPGPLKTPSQSLSTQPQAWSYQYFYIGSQDVMSLGKYLPVLPRKQVRYTDHGRDEVQEWSCQ